MIGSVLLEIKPFRDSRDGEPHQYKVIGETRSSWIVSPLYEDGTIGPSWHEKKVDKKTMIERGSGERKATFMTIDAWEYRKRRFSAEQQIRNATSGYSWTRELSDADLNKIAVILKIDGYIPPPRQE